MSLVKNCEFLDVRTTGMHSMMTDCSCVISMDLTVCHKQKILFVILTTCSSAQAIISVLSNSLGQYDSL